MNESGAKNDTAPAAGKTGRADPRVFLAAERTLLAWMRTGLAMMGFGFVVARFGLFLREIAAIEQHGQVSSREFSLWAGTGLVLLGVIVNLAAAVKHWDYVRALRNGDLNPQYSRSLGLLVAAALALGGLAMAVYLVVTR